MTAPAAELDSGSALQLSSQDADERLQSAPPAAAASELRQPLGQSRRREPAAADAADISAQHQEPLPAAGRVPALPALPLPPPPLMLHSHQPARQPQGSGFAGAAEKRPSLHVRGLPPAKRPKSSGGPLQPAGSAGSSSGDPAAAAAVGAGAPITVPQDSQLASGRCGQGTWFWTRSGWLWGVCLWPSPHQCCFAGSLCCDMRHLDLAVPV
jgi:hypothetical protein